ncbi:DNA-binding protein Alba [Infirmifilum sp. SLHALR2]|nr:MAG: hypothetical protein B7L53_06120 [Thermofilum sp. NZ13]
MSQESTVYIGERPASTYILEVLTLLKKGAKKLTVKARGQNISKAAHVTESVKRMTGDKVSYGQIKLYSEEVGEETKEKSVPVIEIEIISHL